MKHRSEMYLVIYQNKIDKAFRTEKEAKKYISGFIFEDKAEIVNCIVTFDSKEMVYH